MKTLAVEFAGGLAVGHAVGVEDAGVDESEWVLASDDGVVDPVDGERSGRGTDRDGQAGIATEVHATRAGPEKLRITVLGSGPLERVTTPVRVGNTTAVPALLRVPRY